ncbi:MAG: prolyl oligopeptidase family serine peptidase [Planctomycetota bacterium]
MTSMLNCERCFVTAIVAVAHVILVGAVAIADAPLRTGIKTLPPKGQALSQEERQGLEEKLAALTASIDKLIQRCVSEGKDTGWLPDVEVFARSVRLALSQRLFYKPNDVELAHALLERGQSRLHAASMGQRGLALLGFQPESSEVQTLAGGFRSQIDDSIQPFGLVIPPTLGRQISLSQQGVRLDVWLHGRGDTKAEMPFLTERLSKPGQVTPPDAVVLHPFGRHCNAFKFAGETDVFEAIRHVGKLFQVDPQRVSIRGFSMGGAGCWHLAVHHPNRWFAVNPGAGFVDTLVYQGWQEPYPFPVDVIQNRLLNWYDVLPWTRNLNQTRVITYSGELDKQKQAADRVMARAKEFGHDWPYVIGEGMGHKIDPGSRDVMAAQLSDWAALSDRASSSPRPIDFTTYSLRYSKSGPLQITGLARHGAPGRVQVVWSRLAETLQAEIECDGVTSLELDGLSLREQTGAQQVSVVINQKDLGDYVLENAEPAGVSFHLTPTSWVAGYPPTTLRKRPGLQGPIDDALCSRFVWVMPSRPARHGRVETWSQREAAYAQRRWREIMRGDVRVIRDDEVTEQIARQNHLICFGDMMSNRYLATIAEQLPIRWDDDEIRVGEKTLDASHHALVMCYPNPRQPDRYVVINSGMTFRDFSNNSNSRQIAMLPDWAVIDVRDKDDVIFPGAVAARGFFDENWKLP